MQLLKFITCGSVDDGKSTLIGHILYDSKLLYTDQEKALELDSKVGSREGKIDYSLLLDGLMAEREQGITIDVAYRYFTTDARSFIVADTPGHEEYTRNMAVGASFADLSVILIDAKQGVLVQTRRHARICSLMGIRYFVFAVNKMDLVGYSQQRFDEITAQVKELAEALNLEHVVIIPVSATEGDNVTKRSENIPWYDGPVLLEYLEQVDISEDNHEKGFYMPVQRVCRPNHNFRGFQGQIENGSVKKGDEITILPSGEKAHAKSIHVGFEEVEEAFTGQPATITLDKEVDVSRGCVLSVDADIQSVGAVQASILWMDDVQLEEKKNFYVKLGTKQIPGTVSKILYAIDVNTGEEKPAEKLNKNEIAVCEITFADAIVADQFSEHKTLGELILIDRVTNSTAACGVVKELLADETGVSSTIDRETRSLWKGQRSVTVEFPIGEKGITEEFIAAVEKEVSIRGRHTYVYIPKIGDPVKEVVSHLNEAGILVLLGVKLGIDTSVFNETRLYYSDWISGNSISVSDAADFVYKASGIHSAETSYGDYI